MTDGNTVTTNPETAPMKTLTRAQRKQIERGAMKVVTVGEMPSLMEILIGQERRLLGHNQNALHATMLCIVAELDERFPGFRDAVKARIEAVETVEAEQPIPPTGEEMTAAALENPELPARPEAAAV